MATRGPEGVVIGFDIGGTKTAAVAFDHRFNELAHVRATTDTGGVEAVGGSVLSTLATLLEQLDGMPISSIGVGIPGLVDRRSGTVRQAVNLGVGDEPLDVVGLLTAACSVRCCVDNDVNIAALGAFELLRHDRDIANLAYLSVGTGIAAGIILDGHLHRGRRGVAGEIGHLPVDRDGPECECGLRGCLEAVASGPAIARHWPATATTSAAEGLLAAALDGDRDARAAVELIADHLAHAVYVLAVTFDVDCIIVGGGVADAGEPLLDAIRSGVSRLEARSRFVASLELGQRIELKPAGAVGAVGAAALAMSDDGCSRP